MSVPADPFEKLSQVVADGLREYGGELHDQVQQNLSVPVEYARGPRGGTIVIRSKPSEHPRRETGGLLETITDEVTAEGDQARLMLSSDHPGAGHLQDTLDRPIFSNLQDEAPLVEKLADKITSSFQE